MYTLQSDSAFQFLTTAEQFDAVRAASSIAPVVLFKHSPTCGTSAQAYDEMDDLLRATPGLVIHLIDVLASRSLSRDIAAAVGVRHESPQVLILRDGHVAWHGSHWRVTQEAVRDALAAASSPSVGQGVAG